MRQTITTLSKKDGLVDGNIYPILEDGENGFWIGASNALSLIKTEKLQIIRDKMVCFTKSCNRSIKIKAGVYGSAASAESNIWKMESLLISLKSSDLQSAKTIFGKYTKPMMM